MSVKLLYFSVHVLSPYGGFMNLKLWASCGAIIASATFAQDASYTQTAPVQGVQMVPVQTAQGIQMMPVAQPVQGTQMQAAPAAQPTQMQTADQPQAAQMVPVQTAQGVQMMPVAQPVQGTPTQAVPAAQPVEEKKLEPLSPLDAKLSVLRGNSYNFVGNELAAPTVGLPLGLPYMMSFDQFLYVEPTNNKGYVSFKKGLTFYGGLDNSIGSVGLMTIGIASPSFGLGVDIGISKNYRTKKPDGGDEVETTTINVGDDVGLNFAMPIGGLALAISADWLTTGDEETTDEEENDLWRLSGSIGLTNNPSARDFGWSAGLQFLRNTETQELTSGGKTVDITSPNSRIEIDPYFNFAFKVLQNDMARVMLGSNNMFAVQIFDKGDAASDTYKEHMEFGLQITPNIWADVAITDNWFAFGGLSHNILVFGYETVKYDDDSEESLMQIHSSQTKAQLGLRFQWKMLAVEASLEDVVYEKSFAAAFNGENLFLNMGFFLNF